MDGSMAAGQESGSDQDWHLRTTGKKVSLASIQLGVHAFAASAGLTLRKSKAGRGRARM